MAKNMIEMYDNKVWGIKVSEYGLEKGYLDYRTLSEMVGPTIMNNEIIKHGEWEQVSGGYEDIIHTFYIISKNGYNTLKDYTDEAVFYNDEFDMYLWGIDHYGTNWDYVLTNIELIKEGE